MNDDALPAMPSWDNAPSKQVLEDPKNGDVELGRLDPVHEQAASMLANQAPAPYATYGQNPSTVGLPYQQYGAYHGGDLGNPYGQPHVLSPQNTYGSAPGPFTAQTMQQYGYHGMERQQGGGGVYQNHNPGYLPQPQTSYGVYAPSVASASTRYEPSMVYAGQESGRLVQSGRPGRQRGVSGGVTRKPVQDSWREV